MPAMSLPGEDGGESGRTGVSPGRAPSPPAPPPTACARSGERGWPPQQARSGRTRAAFAASNPPTHAVRQLCGATTQARHPDVHHPRARLQGADLAQRRLGGLARPRPVVQQPRVTGLRRLPLARVLRGMGVGGEGRTAVFDSPPVGAVAGLRRLPLPRVLRWQRLVGPRCLAAAQHQRSRQPKHLVDPGQTGRRLHRVSHPPHSYHPQRRRRVGTLHGLAPTLWNAARKVSASTASCPLSPSPSMRSRLRRW